MICRDDSFLSKAEVMLIMILFHNSGYRCLKKPCIVCDRMFDRQ